MFSKAYWKEASEELRKPRMLVFAAMMVALRVVLKGLSIPIGVDLRINFGFFVNAYGASVFGPVVAIVGAVVSDTLGCIFFPTGAYFFPFIFVEIAGSLIFALIFYKREITATRCIVSRFLVDFLVNIVLNTPIMALYYQLVLGKYYALIDLPRIAKNLALFPVESLLLILFFRAVLPMTKSLGFTCSGTDGLRFTKKRVALLIALLLVGVASVAGYSIYSYNTTSLSASYTAEERLQENERIRDVVLSQNPELGTAEDTVAVIESALPKFGSDQISYEVAVYHIDAEGFSEKQAEDETFTLDSLNGLSKSKAKAEETLKYMAQVSLKMTKNGELLTYSIYEDTAA